MSTTVLRPDGWVAGDPVKLLLCVHAAGGDDTDPFGTNSATARTAARAAGYTLLSVASAGYSNRDWGNPASVADYVSAYDAFDATENIVGTVLWGASMGGLAAATLAANGSIPTLRGVLLMYPVLSIADMYADNAAYRTEIDTSYSASAGQGAVVAASVSCDPYLRTTSLFTGIPFRISASSSDTVVNKAHQATAFATKISGVATVTAQATSGEHGDASNWVWADFSGWLSSVFDVAEGYGNTVSSGYGAATAYHLVRLVVDPTSTEWSQVDALISVRVSAAETSTVAATVTSTGGGLIRYRGADAGLFEVSLDGTTWATAVDVPTGTSTVYLRVTPATAGSTLSAEVGVPV